MGTSSGTSRIGSFCSSYIIWLVSNHNYCLVQIRSSDWLIRQLYYPTVLVIVQKRAKRVQISHDILQLVIVSSTVSAHSVTLAVFFQVTEKVEKG